MSGTWDGYTGPDDGKPLAPWAAKLFPPDRSAQKRAPGHAEVPPRSLVHPASPTPGGTAARCEEGQAAREGPQAEEAQEHAGSAAVPHEQEGEVTRYKVVAAYVPVRVPSADRQLGAIRITGTVDLYRDAIVPEDADPEQVENLLAIGMIEPVSEQ
jgi:hypothetical protein